MTTNEYNNCVDNYADNIYRFVLKHIKNVDATRDIVQETFAKVWVKRETIEFSKARSYFFTTAHHTLIDTVRKEKYMQDETAIDREYYQKPIGNLDLQEQLEEALDQSNTVEQPYRLITNAASDLINREVSFTREKDNATENYVAYGFKLGKFEFERKKSK